MPISCNNNNSSPRNSVQGNVGLNKISVIEKAKGFFAKVVADSPVMSSKELRELKNQWENDLSKMKEETAIIEKSSVEVTELIGQLEKILKDAGIDIVNFYKVRDIEIKASDFMKGKGDLIGGSKNLINNINYLISDNKIKNCSFLDDRLTAILNEINKAKKNLPRSINSPLPQSGGTVSNVAKAPNLVKELPLLPSQSDNDSNFNKKLNKELEKILLDIENFSPRKPSASIKVRDSAVPIEAQKLLSITDLPKPQYALHKFSITNLPAPQHAIHIGAKGVPELAPESAKIQTAKLSDIELAQKFFRPESS